MKRPLGLAVVGPGRAGGAIAIAAMEVGHRVETVPGPSGSVPAELADTIVPDIGALSACDLVLVATPDDMIEEVANRVALHSPSVRVAAHLSGFGSIDRLASLERMGVEVGCLHPLQTLPTPRRGAQALRGSAAAVTARTDRAALLLHDFAHSLGISTFDLEDRHKPLYHAGAATVALGVPIALGVAADLLAAAGVSLDQARGLASQVVENCFLLGPDRALTGPVVRGDRGTIEGHLRAAEEVSENLARQYRMLGLTAAARRGAGESSRRLLAALGERPAP